MDGLLAQFPAYSEFQDITQVVKSLVPGTRLQEVRTYRLSGGIWALIWRLYPEPGWVLWGLEKEGRWGGYRLAEKVRKTPDAHPVGLYLKAHFLEKRLERVTVEERDGRLTAHFLFGEKVGSLRLTCQGSVLELQAQVPGMKVFKKSWKAGLWALPEQEAEVRQKLTARVSVEEKKWNKLLANVGEDLRLAEAWLVSWEPVCALLEREPQSWDQPERFGTSERQLIEEEQARGELPSWGRAHMKTAFKMLFDQRRRMERKRVKARQRQQELLKRGAPQPQATSVSVTEARGSLPAQKTSGASFSRKKPGLWVQCDEGLWARVGRNARENDELFRQARDNDLWFHVHGGEGAHVWIPRGQAGWGAKSPATAQVIWSGCQLALLNSSLAKGRFAVVDYTERRNLKKIRGQAGGVRILRSETRSTELNAEFEQRILRLRASAH